MRRHLGFDAKAWRVLPWHEQRAYRDGLRQEFLGETPAQPAQTPEASQAELEAMGVTFIHQ